MNSKRSRLFKTMGTAILLLTGALVVTQRLALTAITEDAAQRLAKISQDEINFKKELAKKINGRILFDSNRTETFGIYTIRVDGSDLQKIVDTDWQDIYPDPSPDGKLITYARAKTLGRRSFAEIWLVNPDGTWQRKLTDNGTFPTFSSDGKTVYFERQRAMVMAIGVDGNNEHQIFPSQSSKFGRYQVVKPRISPDGKYVSFTSDRKGRWNAWYADLATGKAFHLGKGCEPAAFSGENSYAYVRTIEAKAGSGIFKFDTNSGKISSLIDNGPPRGHEYFPTVTAANSYLLFSDCPAGQHSHNDANYQLFIREFKSGKTVGVTFDDYTNRWPKLLRSASVTFGLNKSS